MTQGQESKPHATREQAPLETAKSIGAFTHLAECLTGRSVWVLLLYSEHIKRVVNSLSYLAA